MKLLNIIWLFIVFLSFNVSSSETSTIEDLKMRVSELEADKLINIFSFSGSLNLQYFSVETPPAKDKIDLFRLRNVLNVNADVSERVKFYSRYAMSKHFNVQTQENVPANTAADNLTSTIAHTDSKVRVERAYFDYHASENLSFSFGRLPTMGGPPLNYLNNLPRQSTYPMLAYNAELDGAAITYNLDGWVPKDHYASLRFIYTPFTHINFGNSPFPLSKPLENAAGEKSSTDLLFTFLGEYGMTGFESYLDEINFLVQYNHLNNVSFADQRLSALPQAGVNNTTFLVQYPSNFVDIKMISLNTELINIWKVGLSLYASFFMSETKTNNLARINNGASPSLGFRRNSLGTSHGQALLLSLNQNLSFSKKEYTSFGFEYFQSDKNVVSPTQLGTSEEPLGFYNTMGSAYHAYFLIPLEEVISFRLGYRHQRRRYFPSISSPSYSLGVPQSQRETIRTFYISSFLEF